MLLLAFVLGLMAGGLVATVVLAALVASGHPREREAPAPTHAALHTPPAPPVVRHRASARRTAVPRPRQAASRVLVPRRLAPDA